MNSQDDSKSMNCDKDKRSKSQITKEFRPSVPSRRLKQPTIFRIASCSSQFSPERKTVTSLTSPVPMARSWLDNSQQQSPVRSSVRLVLPKSPLKVAQKQRIGGKKLRLSRKQVWQGIRALMTRGYKRCSSMYTFAERLGRMHWKALADKKKSIRMPANFRPKPPQVLFSPVLVPPPTRSPPTITRPQPEVKCSAPIESPSESSDEEMHIIVTSDAPPLLEQPDQITSELRRLVNLLIVEGAALREELKLERMICRNYKANTDRLVQQQQDALDNYKCH